MSLMHFSKERAIRKFLISVIKTFVNKRTHRTTCATSADLSLCFHVDEIAINIAFN